MPVVRVIHLWKHDTGHIHSTDCWCEPSEITTELVEGLPGLSLVVLHNDFTPHPHANILQGREINNDWITRVLSFEPNRLPPSEGD